MKKEKQLAVFEMMRDLVETSVDLGMAKQRHMDAASEEQVLGEQVNNIAQHIGMLLNNGTIVPKKDLN